MLTTEILKETAGLTAPVPELLTDCGNGQCRPILIYPHTALRHETVEASFDDDLRKLVADLAATLYASKGLGISAPQIGVSRRVFLIDLWNGREPQQGQPASQLLVVVNPTLWVLPGSLSSADEGCLSFPGVQIRVARAAKITLKAYNHRGQPWALSCGALLARVIQHEYDHLNGKVLVDHLDRRRTKRLISFLRSLPTHPA